MVMPMPRAGGEVVPALFHYLISVCDFLLLVGIHYVFGFELALLGAAAMVVGRIRILEVEVSLVETQLSKTIKGEVDKLRRNYE